MEPAVVCVGIDVAKDHLDVAVHPTGDDVAGAQHR